MAHEKFIDTAVEVALELRNHRALPVRPRQPDGMDRRLGSGHREAQPPVRSEDPKGPFRIGRLELVGRAEHRGAGRLEAIPDRLHDARVAVAQDERAEGEAVVDVLVAIEVPETASFRLLHRDWVWIEVFHAGRDPAGEG